MLVNFPKRIKYSKNNPIEDFYKKCIGSFLEKSNIHRINVTAFTVNPKDYNKLKLLLDKHMKINHPLLSYKRRKFEVSMYLLNYGPRVSKKIELEKVMIKEEELYVDNN